MEFIIIVVALIIVIKLYSRVDALEKKVEALSKGGVVKTSAPAQAAPTPAPVEVKPHSITEAFLQPEAVKVTQPAPQPAAPAKKAEEGGTEFAVGSKIFTGVGVLALILGVSFFLRYAFTNNLISEGMRVGLGIVFGLIIVGVGHYLRAKFEQYANTLIGAGLGILYLSIYAAYNFYHLISVGPAFVFLAIVTASGVALALSYNSKALVGYAFFGAFLIPLVLPLSQSVHALFAYLIVLNIGVLLTARFKIWPEFTIASLAGTCLLFLAWVFGPYNASLYTDTIFYITILFIIFFISSLLNFVYRDRDYKGLDGLLLYGIPTLYFFLMLTIVHGKDDVALLSFLIGIFYIIMSFAVRAGFGHVGELKKFSNALLCIASPFIAAATVLHFEGSTITVLWAVEAIVMVVVGYLIETKSNRIAGLILSILTGLRVLVFELGTPKGELIFNSRSAILFFTALMFLSIWYIYNQLAPKMQSGIGPEEREAGRIIPAAAFFLTMLLWVSLEAHDFLRNYMDYLSLIWMILAAVMLCVGAIAREKTLRVMSFMLLFLTIFTTFSFVNTIPDSSPVFFNIRLGTTLVFILVVAFAVWLMKVHGEVFSEDEKKLSVTLMLFANIGFVWAFSMEILTYFNRQMVGGYDHRTIENTKRVALSGFWLLYALIGLGVGIVRKSIFVRYGSIILFAITIFKIFLYDTANLSDVYRFVSFLSLGVILLIAGFSYYRFKHRILEFVSGTEGQIKPPQP